MLKCMTGLKKMIALLKYKGYSTTHSCLIYKIWFSSANYVIECPYNFALVTKERFHRNKNYFQPNGFVFIDSLLWLMEPLSHECLKPR